jgi:Ca2+-binding RTX toxin-like protein
MMRILRKLGPMLALAVLAGTNADEASARSVLGTPGPDRLTARGVAGHQISGSGGGDTIVGGPAADQLLGETGPDHVLGGAGDDSIDGGSGDDRIAGQDGNDSAIGGFGRDTIEGGEGNDVLDSGAAGDRIDGGGGDDVLHGGSGTDWILGGPGNDQLYSDSGKDAIVAGEGEDVVWVNNGSAVGTVDCGAGHDTIHVNPYGRPGGISNAQALRAGRIRGCEVVIESARVVEPGRGLTRMVRSRRGKTLRGSDRNDKLLGGTGPDVLLGLAGDDVLWGNRKPTGASRGTDRLFGGDGNDTVYGSRGRNRIDGGPGDDYLQGGPLHNTLLGGAGNDTLRLTGRGRNRVFAGDGDDVVEAYSRTPVTIDCGPGADRVNIGFNRRVRTRECETVTRRYARRARGSDVRLVLAELLAHGAADLSQGARVP